MLPACLGGVTAGAESGRLGRSTARPHRAKVLPIPALSALVPLTRGHLKPHPWPLGALRGGSPLQQAPA